MFGKTYLKQNIWLVVNARKFQGIPSDDIGVTIGGSLPAPSRSYPRFQRQPVRHQSQASRLQGFAA